MNIYTNEEREARKTYMRELYQSGFTHQQIGDKFGISRQGVQQTIGKGNHRYFRFVDEERCIYSNLRKWLNDNKVCINELTRRVYGNTYAGNVVRTKHRLIGKVELTKTYIDKLIEITGLTYEELFRKED